MKYTIFFMIFLSGCAAYPVQYSTGYYQEPVYYQRYYPPSPPVYLYRKPHRHHH